MATFLQQPAPDFILPATHGGLVSLSQFSGQYVLLYFYPRDNTPGCTQQGVSFAENYSSFLQHKTLVLGISRDNIASHVKFKAKYAFPFELLADTDGAVCKLYEVIKPKNLYGKMVEGIERSTFLIDKSGVLRAVWRKVKVAGHTEQVLTAIENLAG